MQIVLAVAAGGFLGAAARFGIDQVLPGGSDPILPWATLLVNLSGSWLLGLLVGSATRWQLPPWLREGLGTGLLGAFTTFSAFSAQMISLIQQGENTFAMLYAVLSGGIGWFLALWGLRAGRGSHA